MKIKRLIELSSAFVLSLSSLLIISAPAVHAAGTKTWTGTDCTGGTPNCNWNDGANWGGTAPSGGEDLIFNNAIINPASGVPTPIDNISGLSVNSITFINNGLGGGLGTIQLNNGLTVVSAITQASSVTNTTDDIESNSGNQTITLGGDVTVTTNQQLSLGITGDSIALAGHTLTFADGPATTGKIVAIGANITGAGTVTYNAPTTEFQLSGTNTYTGTTNVTASNLWVSDDNDNSDGFGASAINVGGNGSIGFSYNTAATISNLITIAGTVNGASSVTSLNFDCGTGCSGPVTINVPNLTLNGNARFDANSNQTINLAGITANGFCVEYLVGGGSQAEEASHFPGGPAACLVDATTGNGAGAAAAPKTPNTGLAAIKANPAVAIGISAAAAGALVIAARRVRPATKR